ncbi:MAG: tetratricopeptide repeat protein [Gemmatimonadaceae bacterium]
MTPASPLRPQRMGEYKRTIFDRHGPAAADRVQAITYGAMVFGLTFGVMALEMGISIWTPIIALAAGALAAGATMALSGAVGGAVYHITATGASTPYEEQYSYQQSLVMQGKVDEALASFEQLIADNRLAIEPRIRAAELYAKRPEGARRAAELLREAQRIPGIAPGRDSYVTNQLVDLLAGALGQPGKAMVELRRLIERYPNSRSAEYARVALARIKQDVIGR